jgi:general secretion pathway protein E
MGARTIEYADFPEEPYKSDRLSTKFLKQKLVFPLSVEDHVLTIAASNPDDEETLDAIRLATGLDVRALKASEADILRAMDQYFRGGKSSVDEIIEDIELEPRGAEAAAETDDVGHLREVASEAPVVRLVNQIITSAVESRASDIHIEPYEKTLRLRYRIDDILHDREDLPMGIQAAVVSRIKILANLNIAERRLPQDGKIMVRLGSKDIDLRVATMPTVHGEGVVIRILDRSGLVLDLAELGLSRAIKEGFQSMITRRPYGMVLVTGPTGSGKTTTLYATLEKLNTPEKKIITIEDPVEYQLHGVNQIQVKPQIGLTFANGLRSIVRQDPNIILVGEIRDKETAEIAIHAALTGHLVFSTLHTNDASGAIARLIEMGLEDYLIASSLIGVVAQRLVRKVCKACGELTTPNESELREFKPYIEKTKEIKIYRPVGCKECVSSGYWGRIGIFELLLIDDDIRSLILKSPESASIKAAAVSKGLKTLKEDGMGKVLDGTTTIDEVLRVTQED